MNSANPRLLAVNDGSSSIKWLLFEADPTLLRVPVRGLATEQRLMIANLVYRVPGLAGTKSEGSPTTT